MKKIILTCLFSSLLLLAACGSNGDNSASTSTTLSADKNSSIKTNSDKSSIESSSEQNSIDTSMTESSSRQDTAFSSEEIDTTNSLTQEQALELIKKQIPEMNNEDIALSFYNMIDNDYLFLAQSISLKSQGGSGTVGFYRVSPQGTVTLTDSFGNSL